MPILVTGAGGFVGRHVCSALLQSGADVIGIDTNPAGIKEGVRAVIGDLGDRTLRAEALHGGVSAIIHLATVPGGAAEADPAASRRINLDAMYDLLVEAAERSHRPKVVFASSIAVFAEPLPAVVDDTTPLGPKLIYGGHKAMMEQAVAMFSNRGAIDGVTLRLPGIVARPKGPSGMKSAFMSDIFHALKAGEAFVCPVAATGTIWIQSVRCVARNFVRALQLDTALLPPTRAVTLPALRVTLGAIAAEIAAQVGTSPDLVEYRRDPALEAAFAAQPPLATPAAERAGFVHDGDVSALVNSALETLG